MKNLMKLFVLVSLVSLTMNAYAQSIGPKFGLNLASWTGDEMFDDDAYKSVLGLQFGAVAEFPFSDMFAVQAELLYFQKGVAAEFDFLGEKITTESKLNYLEVPVLAKVSFINEPVQVYVTAGPSFGYGLNGKTVAKSDTEEDEEDIDFDENELARFELSASFGAGVQIPAGPGKFFVDGRYLLGLTNVDASEPEGDRTDIFNRGLGISVGVLFPIGG
jgi:hypothetical protein